MNGPELTLYTSTRCRLCDKVLAELYNFPYLQGQIEEIDVFEASAMRELPDFIKGVPTLVLDDPNDDLYVIDGLEDIIQWIDSNGAIYEESDEQAKKAERAAPTRNKVGSAKFSQIGSRKNLGFNPKKFDFRYAERNNAKAQEMLTTKVGKGKSANSREYEKRKRNYEKERQRFDRNVKSRYH